MESLLAASARNVRRLRKAINVGRCMGQGTAVDLHAVHRQDMQECVHNAMKIRFAGLPQGQPGGLSR